MSTLQRTRRNELAAYWKHLRVPFQLTLAPIFLWGAFVAGGLLHARFALAFVSFHLCLYTGVTAFNSCYDRDVGPVGGMLAPPPVPRLLLPFSVLVQCIGLALAAFVNLPFVLIYAVGVVLGVLYSHPRFRWKAAPALSAITVFVGQGGLGFLAGWAAANGVLIGAMSIRGAVGLLTAAFTTVGLYPITQAYQVEEDRARGDRTLPVALGPARAIRLGAGCLCVGGVCAVLTLVRIGTLADASIVGVAYVGLVATAIHIAKRYNARTISAIGGFRFAMRLSFGASTGLTLFILLHMIHR